MPRGELPQARFAEPTPPSGTPCVSEASSTRRSPSTAKRSASSPTLPIPTATSASPYKLRGSLTSDRRIPRNARSKPDYPCAHNDLGVALKDQGRLDEAIAEYRTALRLNPNLAPAHASLGAALSRQGKLDEAIAEYRRRSASSPICSRPTAHTNLGDALRDQGKLDEAIAEFRAALRLKPDMSRPARTSALRLHQIRGS